MAQAAVEQSYEEKVTDEFVVPTVIVDAAGIPKATIQPGDGWSFNFRRIELGRSPGLSSRRILTVFIGPGSLRLFCLFYSI